MVVVSARLFQIHIKIVFVVGVVDIVAIHAGPVLWLDE